MLNLIDSTHGSETLGCDGLRIRRMEIEDLEAVVSISAASRFAPWSSEMFLGEMKHPSAHCFVIGSDEFLENRTPGFICFRTVQDESELLNLGVHPRFRRMGFGRKLMYFYFDFCTRINVKMLYLEVNPSNEEALRLYLSLGYEPFGTRDKFYAGKEDALLLRREI
jgi:ribosomal-protein-alanine N-acetyltransferase